MYSPNYRISSNFSDYLINFFFAISAKSQNIENTEIMSCIIFYKKL